VAERIKESVATHTGAGSNPPAAGGIFLRQVTVSGEKCRHPGMAVTYGCPLENLPNQKHTCLQTYNFSPTNKKTNSYNDLSCHYITSCLRAFSPRSLGKGKKSAYQLPCIGTILQIAEPTTWNAYRV